MRQTKKHIIFISIILITIAITLQTKNVFSAAQDSLSNLTDQIKNGGTDKSNNLPGLKITPNYGGSPLWSTQPFCYKHQGNPGGPKVLQAQTCNAGRKMINGVIVYFADCGVKNSVGCQRQYSGDIGGCLWYVCLGKNAIWDSKTKKCGCDNGPSQRYNLQNYTSSGLAAPNK